jgi:hypothetical protein
MKMWVPDPVRPSLRKSIYCLLNGIFTTFNKITDQEIACAVEAVVAMNPKNIIFVPIFGRCAYLLILTYFINQLDEIGYLGVCGRNFGNSRKLMIFDTCSEASRIIHWVIMADV